MHFMPINAQSIETKQTIIMGVRIKRISKHKYKVILSSYQYQQTVNDKQKKTNLQPLHTLKTQDTHVSIIFPYQHMVNNTSNVIYTNYSLDQIQNTTQYSISTQCLNACFSYSIPCFLSPPPPHGNCQKYKKAI